MTREKLRFFVQNTSLHQKRIFGAMILQQFRNNNIEICFSKPTDHNNNFEAMKSKYGLSESGNNYNTFAAMTLD